MPEKNGDLSTTCVDFLPVTAKTNLSEDQQLWLGWQALRWAMQKKGFGLFEDELSVNMVDPGLSYMLRQHPEDQICLRSLDLAGLPQESAEQASGFTWRLYDSLSVPMKAQQEAQIFLGSLLDSEFVLPERANSAVQPEGSSWTAICTWHRS